MRNLKMIARLRAKQAQGWQYRWVAVEKHEMPRWIDTFRHVGKKNKNSHSPKKIRGPVPQNT
jgi:hypothetical protein